jgi:hypothetical protein
MSARKSYLNAAAAAAVSSAIAGPSGGPGRELGENGHAQLNVKGAVATHDVKQKIKKHLVVLNTRLVRSVNPTSISSEVDTILQLLAQCPTDIVPHDLVVKLIVLAVYQRDIEDGKGERDIFYHIIRKLWYSYQKPLEVVLRALYDTASACWKDILLMIEKFDVVGATPQDILLCRFIFRMMLDAAQKDKALIDAGQSPKTLVFKWMPRQQTHFGKQAARFRDVLFSHIENKESRAKAYRQLLSSATEKLKTVEAAMCAGKWSSIDPAKVPSKAMKVYRKAFQNVDKKGHQRSSDPERVALAQKLIAFLASGKTLHGKTLMVHEIITQLRRGHDAVLVAQLQNIVDEFRSSFPDDIGLILPLADVSGSMGALLPSSTSSCMDVSIALAFLLSQIDGPFKNKVMTFHSDPRIYDLSGGATLYDKIKIIQGMSWGMTTDFGAAMDYLLRSLIDQKVDKESVQALNLIVFSDMQFNAACGTGYSHYSCATSDPWAIAQERIEKMYQAAGFPVPRIIYWNLNARESAGLPAHAETKGVAMLSGFSQAALKTFLAGDLLPEVAEEAEPGKPAQRAQKNPWEVLDTCFNKYIWVMQLLEQSGLFPGYVAPKTEEDEDDDETPVTTTAAAAKTSGDATSITGNASVVKAEVADDGWVDVE